MSEAVDSSSGDKDKSKADKRQEGDGFAWFVHQITSGPVSDARPLEKLNNQMVLDVEAQPAQTEAKESRLGDTSSRKPATARAGISSQRDLRQQFQQLKNQELIRRILRSTGVFPDNLTTNRSVVGENQSKGANETKEQESPRVQVPLETKKPNNSETKFQNETLKFPKKLLISPVKEEDQEDQEERKQENVDSQENLKKTITETNMQSEVSFVCSKCDAFRDKPLQRPSPDALHSSAELSYVPTTVTPKTEKDREKEKITEEMLDRNSWSHQNVVNNGKSKTKVEELSDRLQKQPNQETLCEILKLLQNQALMIPGEKENVKEPRESLVTAEEPKDDSQWRRQQQETLLMMGTRPNLREKHSRQLADMKDFYEGEIGKLRDQLDSLRGNLTNLQEAIPVKMLEATNHKLDARCNLMEEIASELKSKSQKLEQNNEELEKTCFGLRQTNEALEMRCLFLQKSVQDFEEKQSEMQNKNMFLESKILHLTQASEITTKNCKQLEDSIRNYDKACKELEISNQQFEARFRKCKEENLTLSSDVRDLQGSLQASRKHTQELESTASLLQNEKSDWVLKVDAAQKLAKAAQKRYEEVRLENNDRENMAKKLEEQMGALTLSCENAAKAKDELERNAERDRELLKHLLTEYDAIAKENQELKASFGAWTDKLDISQDEIGSLRGTITKLIQRNNNLEESLKDSLSNCVKTTTDSVSPSARKTWESPVPLKADKPMNNSYTSFSSFESIFNSKGPVTSSPMKSESETPQSIKFEVPWEKEASTPTRRTPTHQQDRKSMSSPDRQAGISGKSPNNLVIKKSDLVTRFDVVFEDSKSGEEVKRSRTGRTSRALGESTTSIFVSNSSNDDTESSSNQLISNAAEAALSAVRAGKVTSQAEWENKATVAKGKGRKEKSNERKRVQQSRQGEDIHEQQNVVPKLERKLSSLAEEKKRLESTLSRIPVHRVTKRSLDDKAFLEKRLDEVIQDIGSVRMQLRRHHAL